MFDRTKKTYSFIRHTLPQFTANCTGLALCAVIITGYFVYDAVGNYLDKKAGFGGSYTHKK